MMKTPSQTLEDLKNSVAADKMTELSANTSDLNSPLENTISSSSSSSNSTSFFTIVLSAIFVILVLSILGINIFIYLAKGTQSTTDFIDKSCKQLEPYVGPLFSDIFKFILSNL